MTEVRRTRTTTSLDGLVEALDQLLSTGACVVGDLVIGLGGVDLIRIDLRALVAGVSGIEAGASS
jgi:gas vesicle protein GvpA/GvpJ/GvpM family